MYISIYLPTYYFFIRLTYYRYLGIPTLQHTHLEKRQFHENRFNKFQGMDCVLKLFQLYNHKIKKKIYFLGIEAKQPCV